MLDPVFQGRQLPLFVAMGGDDRGNSGDVIVLDQTPDNVEVLGHASASTPPGLFPAVNADPVDLAVGIVLVLAVLEAGRVEQTNAPVVVLPEVGRLQDLTDSLAITVFVEILVLNGNIWLKRGRLCNGKGIGKSKQTCSFCFGFIYNTLFKVHRKAISWLETS